MVQVPHVWGTWFHETSLWLNIECLTLWITRFEWEFELLRCEGLLTVAPGVFFKLHAETQPPLMSSEARRRPTARRGTKRPREPTQLLSNYWRLYAGASRRHRQEPTRSTGPKETWANPVTSATIDQNPKPPKHERSCRTPTSFQGHLLPTLNVEPKVRRTLHLPMYHWQPKQPFAVGF